MQTTYSEVNVTHEVCPDPDHILDPGMSSKFNMGPYGDLHSTDFRVFFFETYNPIGFIYGVQLPYGKVYIV